MVHGRDVVVHGRDVVVHGRDVVVHGRDVVVHGRDVVAQLIEFGIVAYVIGFGFQPCSITYVTTSQPR